MSRKLIIDGQVFQTLAWHRGMGKYSLELLAALSAQNAESKNWNEIILLLSNSIPIDNNFLQLLHRRTTKINIVTLNYRSNELEQALPEAHNQAVIDNYINDQESEVDFLILSLLQSEFVPVFPSKASVKKILLIYDLIPLLYPNRYLYNADSRKTYLSKFRILVKADLFLTISSVVAYDLISHLGIDAQRVITIDGGPISHSGRQAKLNIDKPFILMPTGNDVRKNNERAIEAFATFNKSMGAKYNLVITSMFTQEEIAELSAISSNVIFTGNITGSQLSYLYKNCEALLFPSEYEGLGLPILEAIESAKPIACSNIPVFKEISQDAFYYFDPKSIRSISDKLKEAVENKESKQAQYSEILKKYSWEVTAKKLIKAISDFNAPKIDKTESSVAIVGTFSEFMQKTYAELTKRQNAEYFISYAPNQETSTNYLQYMENVKALNDKTLKRLTTFRRVIYYLEGREGEGRVLIIALAKPGLVLLGSTDFEEIWNEAYRDSLISESRLNLEVEINGKVRMEQVKFLASLLSNQKVVALFNNDDREKVKALFKLIGSKTKVIEIDTSLLKIPSKAGPTDRRADMAEGLNLGRYKELADQLVELSTEL